ncbi:MAG TPA: glycine oxidase ThiO [Longimicrobiaceae bacterium]
MDVVVVGGGVIGCAVARELALSGLAVTLVERDEPGANASWAAAGMLSPLAEADRADPFLSLLLRSRAMYPELAGALRSETGLDVEYRDDGTLLVALTEGDEAELEARYRWQAAAGLAVEPLAGDEARRMEPSLSRGVRRALRFPGDHQVDNRLLARALWVAAENAGVEMRRGVEAAAVVRRGDRVEGIATTLGDRLDADWVVVAGGSAAGRLEGLPGPLPVRPVHGQLLALRPRPPRLRHVVTSPRGYLVPRASGRLVVGATVEEIGFRRAVTVAGVRGLIDAALEICPALADAPLTETWSGHRPGTPDQRPILGEDPRVPNLVYATGHYRNGILLVPATARAIADVVLRRPPSIDLTPFGIDRFLGG